MTGTTTELLAFGPFRLDVGQRRLERNGDAVALSPKVFDLLVCLARARGAVLTKDELIAALWPDSFVEEANLTQNVFVLRKALGDDQPYVETVPRRGYRFVPDVQDVTGPAAPIAASAVPPVVTDARRAPSRWVPFVVTAGVLVTLTAVLAPVWRPRAPFSRIGISMATATRDVVAAAISPDGRFLVTAAAVDTGAVIQLRQLATGNTLEIARASESRVRAVAFSPDGEHVYYTLENGVAYRVPAIGGRPAAILRGAQSGIRPSPDGKTLAFIRWSPENAERSLVITDTTGSGERVVLRRGQPDVIGYDGIAWSPDGTRIAVITNESFGGSRAELVEVTVADGSTRIIAKGLPWNSGAITWCADGDGLLVAAGQVWHVNYRDGVLRRVTNDTAHYRGLSATQDGRTLSAVQSTTTATVWRGAWPAVAAPERVRSEGGPNNGITWLPGGRLVYLSYASGDPELWISGDGRRGPQQLTNAPGRDVHPAAPLDGRFIAFASSRDGGSTIWRMNPDGSGHVQLAGPGAMYGTAVSPDGATVAFHAADNTRSWIVWAVPSDGGEPRRLTQGPATFPAFSPDGTSVACNYLVDGMWRIALVPVDGKSHPRILDVPGPPTRRLGWSPDGREIVTAVDGRLDSVSIDTLARRTIVNAPGEQVLALAWTPDGRHLTWVRAIASEDVAIIRDAR